jgi:hypothetical protein
MNSHNLVPSLGPALDAGRHDQHRGMRMSDHMFGDASD